MSGFSEGINAYANSANAGANVRAQQALAGYHDQLAQSQQLALEQARAQADRDNAMRDQGQQLFAGLPDRLPDSISVPALPGAPLSGTSAGGTPTATPRAPLAASSPLNADGIPGAPSASANSTATDLAPLQAARLGLPGANVPAAGSAATDYAPQQASHPAPLASSRSFGPIDISASPLNQALYGTQLLAARAALNSATPDIAGATKALSDARDFRNRQILGGVMKRLSDDPTFADDMLARFNTAAATSGRPHLAFQKDPKTGLYTMYTGDGSAAKLDEYQRNQIIANMILMGTDPDAGQAGLGTIHKALAEQVASMNEEQLKGGQVNVASDANKVHQMQIALERQRMYMPQITPEVYQVIDPATGRPTRRQVNVVRSLDPKTNQMTVQVLSATGEPLDKNSQEYKQLSGNIDARTQELANANEQYRAAFEKLAGNPEAWYPQIGRDGKSMPPLAQQMQAQHQQTVQAINARHDLVNASPEEQLAAARAAAAQGATLQQIQAIGVPAGVAQQALTAPAAAAPDSSARRAAMIGGAGAPGTGLPTPPPTLEGALTGAGGQDKALQSVMLQKLEPLRQQAAVVQGLTSQLRVAAASNDPRVSELAQRVQAERGKLAAMSQGLPPTVTQALGAMTQ